MHLYKKIINTFGIQSMKEFEKKFDLATENLNYYEDEVRKQKWRKDDDINKMWEDLHK